MSFNKTESNPFSQWLRGSGQESRGQLSLYEQTFDLEYELAGRNAPHIWDLGCAHGGETKKLLLNYPGLRLLGVDRMRYDQQEATFPIVVDRIDEIGSIAEKAKNYGIYPPDLILARNTLYYYLERAVNCHRLFDGFVQLLREHPEAKLLIFDHMQSTTYPHYQALAQEHGLAVRLRLPNGKTGSFKYMCVSANGAP